jgi:hypothetical protein
MVFIYIILNCSDALDDMIPWVVMMSGGPPIFLTQAAIMVEKKRWQWAWMMS